MLKRRSRLSFGRHIVKTAGEPRGPRTRTGDNGRGSWHPRASARLSNVIGHVALASTASRPEERGNQGGESLAGTPGKPDARRWSRCLAHARKLAPAFSKQRVADWRPPPEKTLQRQGSQLCEGPGRRRVRILPGSVISGPALTIDLPRTRCCGPARHGTRARASQREIEPSTVVVIVHDVDLCTLLLSLVVQLLRVATGRQRLRRRPARLVQSSPVRCVQHTHCSMLEHV